MIKIQCVGGLGNRMFIYAFARALQLGGKGRIMMYHTCQNEMEMHAQTLKQLIASETDIIHINIESGKDLWGAAPLQMFFLRVTQKLWRLLRPKGSNAAMERTLQPLWNKLGICVISDGYYPFSTKALFRQYLCMGYFQSRQFWGVYDEKIREEMTHPELIADSSREALAQILGTNAVCLHLRLGDYISNPAARRVHYVCDENYYIKAVEQALICLENPTFFAFTDNLALAKQVPFPQNAKIVWMPQGSALSDMQLMAQCRHFIIANSSYSWWAQFLGNAPDKRVFAPDRWFRTDLPVDLYEETWERIPVTLPKI